MNYMEEFAIYEKVLKDCDIVDIQTLIEERSTCPQAVIYTEEDMEKIHYQYRRKYDWNEPGREQLLFWINNYLDTELDDTSEYIVRFLNDQDKIDETSFGPGLDTVYELGELWLMFAKENNISAHNVLGYKPENR